MHVLINAAHTGASNYPENATPSKIILMQRLLLPRSVRQKDYLTALGGQSSCYLRLLLMAWKSDLHDGAQMDHQCTLHPPEKMDMGMYQHPPQESIRPEKQRQPRTLRNYTDLTTNLQHPPKQTSRCVAGNKHQRSKNEANGNAQLLCESISPKKRCHLCQNEKLRG